MVRRALSNTHSCPAPGCEERIPLRLLMCKEHWQQVPPDRRQRVWNAYRRIQEPHGVTRAACQELREAQADAIAYLRFGRTQ